MRTSPLRIGVDATCWQNTRGYGRHARALLSALVRLDGDAHYTLFVDDPRGTESMPAEAARHVVRSQSPTAEAAAALGNRSPADMWRMSRALSRARCDLLLFPTVYSYVPVLSRAKKVVMIHDVIAEKFPQLTLPTRRARWFWNAKVALGRWQADALITVSDYSKECIVEHFGERRERVMVVGEAADPVFRRLDNPQPSPRLSELGLGADQRLVVYLGGFGPHKNIEALVDAFAAAVSSPGAKRDDARLVLVGEYRKEVFHSDFARLEARLRAAGIEDRVIRTGYLPDADVVVLLNRAAVLVLPSLMEGYGLPAVEAAACGCPVLGTTASPLPQLLGEGGIWIDPHDQSRWNAELARVLDEPALRQAMSAAGQAAAARLTWDAAARNLRACLHQVAHHGTLA